MTSKKNIIRNLIFLFSGNAVSAVLLFVSLAHLARVLGPGGFGVISFAEVIFMFFLTLASLGLPYFGTREVAKHADNVPYYVDRILSMRLLLSFMALFLLIFFVLVSKNTVSTKIVFILYGAALIPASLLLDWLFQGLEKMYFMALAVFLKASLFALGAFVFVHTQGEIERVALIFFISWLASSAGILYFYMRRFGWPKANLDFHTQKKFLMVSFPIGISLFVGWVIHYFDSLLLFFLKGKEVAGQYNAAYRPIILIVTALTLIFNAIFPAMSRAAERQEISMKKIVNFSMGGGLIILMPVAVIGSFFSGSIMEMVYGNHFSSSAPVFGALIWWPLLILIITAYSRVLFCFDKQGLIGKISIMTAIANICLNLLFVPFLNGLGASMAKLAADLGTLVVYSWLVKPLIDFPLFDLLKCPLIASIGMAIFFLLFPQLHLINILFGGLFCYGLILLLLSWLIPSWKKLMVTGCYS